MQILKSAPRYQQLADLLRDEIASGRYTFGERLPSEPELCRLHGVSRGTVVKAFEMLVADGIAVRKQGAGTFVARVSLKREPGRLMSFSDTVAAQGRLAGQKLLSLTSATSEQSNSLGLFEPATALTRLRMVDGITTSLHVSLIPNGVMDSLPDPHAEQMRNADVTDFSLYFAYEAAGFMIVRATEHVTTRLALPQEIEALSLQDPSAVMVVTRHSYDAVDRLIEATEAVYQSGHYSYAINLLRSSVHAMPFKVRALQ